jgi:hypothetical protein
VAVCYIWKYTSAVVRHMFCTVTVCGVDGLIQHNRLALEKEKSVLQCGPRFRCVHADFRQRAFEWAGLNVEI